MKPRYRILGKREVGTMGLIKDILAELAVVTTLALTCTCIFVWGVALSGMVR